MTLRNPASEEQNFVLDLAKALELPAAAGGRFTLAAPFRQRELPALAGPVNAFKPVKVTLKPFEVLVFEAIPAGQ